MTAPTLPRETLTCKGNNHAPICEHFPRPPASQTLLNVALAKIDIGPNVRRDAADLEELTASIREHGVLQPVKVVEGADGTFRLVWGQRRVLAALAAGLVGIPAIIVDPDDGADVANPGAKRSIEQLVENLHRADLNPVDRAKAMRDVVDAGISQADLARELGLHSSTIANDLGILDAPPKVLEHVASGRLTASHAKALKGLAPKTQAELAARAVAQGLSAHGLEEAVQQFKRNEEWRQKREEQNRAASKAQREQQTASLARLEKKKVPKDAPIHVSSYSGGTSNVIGLIRKLGYTNVVEARQPIDSKPTGVPCDCKAWKVHIDYGRVAISPGCVKPAHGRSKVQATDDARQQNYALQGRVHKKLAEVLPELVASQPPGRLVAQIALWHALDYYAADWSVEQGGKRTKPWETIVALDDASLARELGKQLAKSFRDRYGYHLPWEQLAAELGVPLEEPKPAPKRKPKAASK